MSNRLQHEKSPYLLQHADNPVDWYPWGDEAFAKARAEAKPIFLSVGYSTCHWCHVMAHESFENESIAKVLNERFVPIKVDREERPDVDRVYMLFVQATAGSGGWPMSVWLTPELKPFYGGTYFPPASRWGRPGFAEILEEISRVWASDPAQVRQSAEHVTGQITKFAAQRASGAEALSRDAAEAILERGVRDFEAAFDRVHGGFDGAPKFPRPSEVLFLLREFARTGNHTPLDMVTATLRAMVRGGIHDHLGGGFHRYSVDARWQVPHFEKMLYDQAQLVLAFVEAFQVTGDEEFRQAAGGILEYVARDLRRPGGGFFSAEDADSVAPEEAGNPRGHGVEGAFYVWTAEEFDRVLGDRAAAAKARFGVKPHGNADDDPHGALEGRNVLFLAESIDRVALHVGRPPEAVAADLDESRRRLADARSARPRPGLDDKVITAWNGLMIAAFARAARVFGHGPARDGRAAGWLNAAQAATAFLRETMWDAASERLLHRFRDGVAGIDAYAEDHACLIFGLVELFQADGDPRWLKWAQTLQRRQDELFWDGSGGGWYSTSGKDPAILVRIKEDYDGAEPAASSLSAWNLLALARLGVGDQDIAARIERTFAGFEPQMKSRPRAVPMMLAALSASLGDKHEVVIVGPAGRPDTDELLSAFASRYLPFAVLVPPGSRPATDVAAIMPHVAAMTTIEGKATAYLCRDFACSRPTTSADELRRQLAHGRVE